MGHSKLMINSKSSTKLIYSTMARNNFPARLLVLIFESHENCFRQKIWEGEICISLLRNIPFKSSRSLNKFINQFGPQCNGKLISIIVFHCINQIN